MNSSDTARVSDFDAYYSGYLSGIALAYETVADESSNVNQFRECVTKCSQKDRICFEQCTTTYTKNQKLNLDKTHDIRNIEATLQMSDDDRIKKMSDHMTEYVTGRKQNLDYLIRIKKDSYSL